MEKYPLKDEICVCGFDLAGKKSIVTGEKNGQPMGACPQCARALPLEVEEPESEPDSNPDPPDPPDPDPDPDPEPLADE